MGKGKINVTVMMANTTLMMTQENNIGNDIDDDEIDNEHNPSADQAYI